MQGTAAHGQPFPALRNIPTPLVKACLDARFEPILYMYCNFAFTSLYFHLGNINSVFPLCNHLCAFFQNERSYQKQPTIFQNKKRVLTSEGGAKEKLPRYHKNVGLGFKTPREVHLCLCVRLFHNMHMMSFLTMVFLNSLRILPLA